MNVTFSGVLPAQSVGDVTTKVEIALPLSNETEAQAVAAGRAVTITDPGQIASFLGAGLTVNNVPTVNDRVAMWHTLTIDVQAGGVTFSYDGVQQYSGTVPAIRTVKKIKFCCVAQDSVKVAKTVYFRNFKKNGSLVDGTDLLAGAITDPGTNAAGTFDFLITRGTITPQSLAPDGVTTCLKLTTDSTVQNGNVQVEYYLTTTDVGTYSVEVWDSLESNISLLMLATDTTTNTVTSGIINTSYFTAGAYINWSGSTHMPLFGWLNKTTPSVRLTESRGGAGAYVGPWVAGAQLSPVALLGYIPSLTGGTANSITLTWAIPAGFNAVTNFEIYRAVLTPGLLTGTFAYLATVSGATTTYTDNTATNGPNSYAYQVVPKDTYHTNAKSVSGHPIAVFNEAFTYADGTNPSTGNPSIWGSNITAGGSVVSGSGGVVTANAFVSSIGRSVGAAAGESMSILYTQAITYAVGLKYEIKVLSLPQANGHILSLIYETTTDASWAALRLKYLSGSEARLVGYIYTPVQIDIEVDAGVNVAVGDTLTIEIVSTTVFKIYKNGVLVQTVTATGYTYPYTSGGRFLIMSSAKTADGVLRSITCDAFRVYR